MRDFRVIRYVGFWVRPQSFAPPTKVLGAGKALVGHEPTTICQSGHQPSINNRLEYWISGELRITNGLITNWGLCSDSLLRIDSPLRTLRTQRKAQKNPFSRENPQNQQPLQLENCRLLRGSALNKPSACPPPKYWGQAKLWWAINQ